MFRPALTAALLLAPLLAVRAQSPAPRNPVAPPPAAPPVAQKPAAPAQSQAPAPPPAAAAPAAPGPGDLITLQFPNSDVQDVLHYYEQLTGKRLVMENNVQGKVNIFIAKPISRDEATRIIEMNLALNGYSLVPAEEGILEVLGSGKNPRTASVPIISDIDELPKGDQVVSFVFKLQYADPTELQQLLAQYFQAAGGSAATILALPKSGSVVATQSASVIRRIADMVEQLDVAPAKVVSEFIPLQRADAQKVVDMLRDIFEKGTGQPGTPGAPGVRPVVNRPPGQPGQPPAPGQPGGGVEIDAGTGTMVLSEEALVVGKIKISADVRTNRIHVITRPMNLPFIRQLISEFDANVEFAKPVVRPLRYVSAADVLPVIVQTLTEPGAQAGTSEAGGNPNVNAQQQAQQRRTTTPSNSAYSGSDFNQGTGTASGGGLNVSEELSTQAVDTTPKAVTIGNAKIIADQRANAILILGNRDIVVKVQKLLDEMDVSSPQVALSTVIGELSLSNTEDFGVNYFSRFNQGNPFSGAATSNNTGTALPPGSRATSGGILDPAQLLNFQQLASAATSGANVYLAAGNTLGAIVRMLDSTGKFKTISRPTVFTSNNKKAIIANGQEIPVPVSTISNVVGTAGVVNTGLAQQSNIQFKKVALQLEVVPLINSEKEVSLDILQKLDSLGTSVTVDNNQIPTINTRYIRTTVAAPNCSTIVLGGLIQDTNTRTQNGIPILSKIPVVGGLFRTTHKDKGRTELLVLMRPEVSLTKADLQRLRRKDEDKSHFGSEIDQDDCPDCPPAGGADKEIDKNVVLPAPDVPPVRTSE